jgi:hypothetical protein
MHACNWASHRGENRSFAAMRQSLCCERQAMAHGSALAGPLAKAKVVRMAATAIPLPFIDANIA